MKELLDKLSSYNIFNYLFPGAIFVAAANRVTDHTFAEANIIVALFAYHFIGLVVSRIGSIFVEPLLKKIGFVTFAPYRDFVRACAVDPKIEALSEQNNTYRTLCALFVTLAAFKGLDEGAIRLGLQRDLLTLIACGALFLLFAFAYRKQTGYVKQRVEIAAPKDAS